MPKSLLQEFGLTQEDIDGLPDQRGIRSWAFEPYLELDQPSDSIDQLLHHLRDKWVQGKDRKPNPTGRANFVSCLRMFLLNVMRANSVDDELTVGIPSGKGRLDQECRYRPAFASVQYYRHALALLQECDVIVMIQASRHFHGYAQTARYALTDRARMTLPLAGLTTRDFSIARRDEVIRLKDTDRRLIKYTDTDDTHAMRHRLQRLNTLLESTNIGSTKPPNFISDFDEGFSGVNGRVKVSQRAAQNVATLGLG